MSLPHFAAADVPLIGNLMVNIRVFYYWVAKAHSGLHRKFQSHSKLPIKFESKTCPENQIFG